jgi:hypothetical protein
MLCLWLIEGKIATVLGQLMKHNITVKELKLLIAALKGQEGKFWPSYSRLLISVLQSLPQCQAPDAFFHFSGSDGAVRRCWLFCGTTFIVG